MVKRIYSLIAGSEVEYSFEHRIFNLTSFVITLFGIQATVFNYLLGLHPATVWLSVLGSLVSVSLFYFSRVRRWFTSATIFIYIVATIVLLGGMHFFNGGFSGTIIYLLIMLLNIFLLIAQQKHQLLMYALLAGTIIALLALEFSFPSLVTPYRSFEERIADHFTVLVYSPFFTMVVIILFRRSYDREHALVLEQKRKLEEAYKITREKNEYIESLIRELHHRVKNNLQVVSSLLSLQSNRLDDTTAKNALEEGRTRVEAMAMIHQKLYLDNELAAVNMEEYLEHLSASLANSFGYSPKHIHTHVQLNKPSMNIDVAIPIGLIVNELITNSFKHAFNGVVDPQVMVSLKNSGQTLELTVADNGKGYEISPQRDEASSFGMKLVQILVDQVNGVMTVDHFPGTVYTIEIRRAVA